MSDQTKENRKMIAREIFLSIFIPIVYIAVGLFSYAGIVGNSIEELLVEAGTFDTISEASELIKPVSIWGLCGLPTIIMYYATSPLYNIRKGLRVTLLVLSCLCIVAITLWQLLPIVKEDWAGIKIESGDEFVINIPHIFATALMFLPSISFIIMGLIFYIQKLRGADFAHALIWNMLAPIVVTTFIGVLFAVCVIGWSIIVFVLSLFPNYEPSDGPCISDTKKVWYNYDWRDVEKTGSRYSADHGGYVDEYQTSDGTRFISADGGDTFEED
ncbi:MAG: hypothetical protein IJE50_00185 [Clostridia bacterium]|nr:hypothetical protein [Clostridia bacterium]